MTRHLGILVAVFLVACGQQLAAEAPDVCVTPIPTCIPGESTATATIEPTPTATQETYTPTPTETIIEVTPLPATPSPHDGWQGLPSDTMYRTTAVMKVRNCLEHEKPSTSCPEISKLAYGSVFEIYALYKFVYSSDEWVCLEYLETVDKETRCAKAIAYKYSGSQFGVITWP